MQDKDKCQSVSHLEGVAQSLLYNSLAGSSCSTYARARTFLGKFYNDTFHQTLQFPVSIQHMLLFIAYCFSHGLASGTVTTYLSAISYEHKIRQFQDPTESFIVKKCLKGYQKLKSSNDVRLPITPEILYKLVQSLQHVSNSYFLRILFKAMYLLAFHAFLRIGEITAKSHSDGSATLNTNDVDFKYSLGTLQGVEIQFKNFKHCKEAKTLYVSCCNHHIDQCPVHSLLAYINFRKPSIGPLSTLFDGTQVTRVLFSKYLQLSLTYSGYLTSRYKGHSFRIGAATTAASMGIEDSKIQMMGRWRSNAFKKYIRIPVLKL